GPEGSADHAAVAGENGRLYESARREAESATTLLEFGRALSAAGSLDEIYERIVDLTADLIGSPRTSVWTRDGEGGLTARKFFGHTEDERRRIERQRFRVKEGGRDLRTDPETFVIAPGEAVPVEPSPLVPDAAYAVA